MSNTPVPSKRELPKVSVAEQIILLTQPEQNPTRYTPFVDLIPFPFDVDATQPSRLNAAWLADAAWLSYCHDQAEVQRAYARAGMEAVLDAAGSTNWTVAWNDAAVIVAFRGTQPNFKDIFDDAQWVPVQWDPGHVHKGFADALQRASAKVAETLEGLKPRKVWFTGHSLGAAIATLAAYRFDSSDCGGVYTFGSPLVGNQVFSGSFNTRFGNRSLRFVNDHDIVTRVPPEEFAFPFGRYCHVDALRSIDSSGNVSVQPQHQRFFSDVIGDPNFLLEVVSNMSLGAFSSIPDALRDHTPLHYVILVWNDFVEHYTPAIAEALAGQS